MVLDRIHGKAYAALSPRTDRNAFEHWCEPWTWKALCSKPCNRSETIMPIYHTNVMMAIGTGVGGCVLGLRGPP